VNNCRKGRGGGAKISKKKELLTRGGLKKPQGENSSKKTRISVKKVPEKENLGRLFHLGVGISKGV